MTKGPRPASQATPAIHNQAESPSLLGSITLPPGKPGDSSYT